MLRTVCIVALLVSVSGAAFAIENFPRPDFSEGYQAPDVTTPRPKAELFSYIDIAVLFLALMLSAYLSLKKRSRRDLLVLVVFSLLYFGFYRQGCICSVGAIQNVALTLADGEYVLPLVVGAFFGLPLLFALFFGRVFCGAVCPLGAAQEVVLLHPVKVPAWLDNGLRVLPYAYLGLAVLLVTTGSAFIICRYDPFVLFFRLGGSAGMLVFGVVVLLLATVIGRPYCRYVCPYGVLLGWLSVFAKWRTSISPGECVNCHLCADACPYGAIRPPTPEPGTIDRREGKGRLALLLVLLPVLVAGGAGLGWMSSPMLARINDQVRLAERLWLEEHGQVEGQTDASEAYDIQGRPYMEAYREATIIKHKFDIGSAILGGWLGLVFAVRMIIASVRRRRETYEADVVACMSCARCYASCPVEHAGGSAKLAEHSERTS
jgi:NosR/NirI family transcriptional regulator, nitrous oxide reductase regulator